MLLQLLYGRERAKGAPPRIAAVTTTALLALSGAASAADELEIDLPLYGAAHLSAGALGSDPGRQSAVGAPDRRPGTATSALLASPRPRFSLIEMPPEAAPPGTGYRRPHHAIGYRWAGAESWLREHGFDAQTCYLPMVRLHTRISASANLSGTLWIYGRCAFR